MKITVNTQSHPGSAVLSLKGTLTADYTQDLENAVANALKTARALVLDFEELNLLDSTGLGALIRCLRMSLAARSSIYLANVKSGPRMVLQLTRTHRLFDIYDSVDAAIAGLELEGQIA
ncbi:anti-sigma factor antagonist [bacterium (Candidatus Blackallbacteria) CG17_big_fil_post_rev_8_21_14_2_50_48_46]|uniref:Anti-sigma factor antagonist n=1 Tax=bacterium (Candidatus Blackallbacteria) CG17_big_fil_post_rev_8_21_14_2_50_48_46 TaxID=2014261 RepID=A0A2M7G4T8_9BACT|nr:MAG: anti-anti-sigma factor [bacterium (Candidatus Blackallbacteria) CG18_big_fil_WC_8_21_14_2_50_49_26]PIW16931.1 MAG: anti-sigma factor antagonist [bacterium (Candidatus Blackallbacteria) CG17_big_fil_post_rev_8_21_14_2_50_48_46]PIW50209.1 MAG: anti-sigma factor antagonist [bacterium (Candidatus Blackallbacteria) CG13_big_fil_rev_8_21_14_2_50_49_14]